MVPTVKQESHSTAIGKKVPAAVQIRYCRWVPQKYLWVVSVDHINLLGRQLCHLAITQDTRRKQKAWLS